MVTSGCVITRKAVHKYPRPNFMSELSWSIREPVISNEKGMITQTGLCQGTYAMSGRGRLPVAWFSKHQDVWQSHEHGEKHELIKLISSEWFIRNIDYLTIWWTAVGSNTQNRTKQSRKLFLRQTKGAGVIKCHKHNGFGQVMKWHGLENATGSRADLL